ncbi:TPA: S49 family peptidase, partial [Neisseria meningitidis]
MQYRIRRENEAPEAKNTGETLWERDIMREVLLSAYQDRRRERMWKNIWRAVSTLILVALIAGIFRKDEAALQLTGNTPHTAVV